MTTEVCIDLDILKWALERVGDDGSDGCRFAAEEGPDHHGPEFAEALFAAIQEEVREYDLVRGTNK